MICVLLGVAYITLLERKLLSYIQFRIGPNKVIVVGIGQPLADALKLFSKERTTPSGRNKLLFSLGPGISLVLALILWRLLPSQVSSHFLLYRILLFMWLSTLNVYPLFLRGWSSNRKYAIIGTLRSLAQFVSYEVVFLLFLVFAAIHSKTYEFVGLMTFGNPAIWLLFPLLLIWLTTMLAECNRTPFDLSEGESELVSGFNIEFGSILFSFLFIAEYSNILWLSIISVFLMSVGGLAPLQGMLIVFFILGIRGVLPRIRYDQLMGLSWKVFLPFMLCALALFSVFV